MSQLNAHHIFRYDGSRFLINIEKMTACLIHDEAVFKALEDISANPRLPVEQGIREELEKLDLLPARPMKQRKKRRSEPTHVQNVTLLVTQKCNLRCTYCYADGGGYGTGDVMTHRTARRAVNWLIERSGKVKKLRIGFIGGEPLLNFPLIQDVVQYALERGRECGKLFVFVITTNGSLLDDEKIAFFKEYDIETLVSIDGPKELQDTQRPFKSGKGSYDVIAPRIRNLLRVLPKSACRATLVGNSDPVAVDNALQEMGFARRHISVASRSFFNTSENNEGAFRKGIAAMLDKAESEAQEILEATGSRDVKKLNDLKGSASLFPPVEQFINNKKIYFNCGAGKSMAAVSCSGDVYLCHRFAGMEGQRLGDIFSEPLKREMYLTSLVTLQDKCASCRAKYVCGGGCYHDNLGATGSVFECAEDMCVLWRRSTELAAAVCGRLSADDRAYLVKEQIIETKPCPTDLF